MGHKRPKLFLVLVNTPQRFVSIFFKGCVATIRLPGINMLAERHRVASGCGRAGFGGGTVDNSHANYEETNRHAYRHQDKHHLHWTEEHPWRVPIIAPPHDPAPCFDERTGFYRRLLDFVLLV